MIGWLNSSWQMFLCYSSFNQLGQMESSVYHTTPIWIWYTKTHAILRKRTYTSNSSLGQNVSLVAEEQTFFFFLAAENWFLQLNLKFNNLANQLIYGIKRTEIWFTRFLQKHTYIVCYNFSAKNWNEQWRILSRHMLTLIKKLLSGISMF